MDKIYVTPELEITEFEAEDVITTSSPLYRYREEGYGGRED